MEHQAAEDRLAIKKQMTESSREPAGRQAVKVFRKTGHYTVKVIQNIRRQTTDGLSSSRGQMGHQAAEDRRTSVSKGLSGRQWQRTDIT